VAAAVVRMARVLLLVCTSGPVAPLIPVPVPVAVATAKLISGERSPDAPITLLRPPAPRPTPRSTAARAGAASACVSLSAASACCLPPP
jgi:hypothetical protein